MSDEIPFYFKGATYHNNKKQFDKLLEKHGIEYDADSKSWISDTCKVVGAFNGFKRPALLTVTGDVSFIDDMKSFANSVGAEIRDVGVRDIRKVRKKQSDEKRIKDEAKKIAFEKSEKKRLEGIESVIRVKLYAMENLSDVFKRDWIMKELGVDISERLGIEPDKSIKKFELFKKGLISEPEDEEEVVEQKVDNKIKPKVAKPKAKNKKTGLVKPIKNKPTSMSLLCKMGNHDACGGYMCSCDCHK